MVLACKNLGTLGGRFKKNELVREGSLGTFSLLELPVLFPSLLPSAPCVPTDEGLSLPYSLSTMVFYLSTQEQTAIGRAL